MPETPTYDVFVYEKPDILVDERMAESWTEAQEMRRQLRKVYWEKDRFRTEIEKRTWS